jgi:hypothetical protein
MMISTTSLLDIPFDDPGTMNVRITLYFDDPVGRSIQIYGYEAPDDELFATSFNLHYEEARARFGLTMIDFEGQFITQGEADDLHICHDSRRPAWTSDQNRQIHEIYEELNIIITHMDIYHHGVLNIYFITTSVPLYTVIPTRNETPIDFFFTCGTKKTTFTSVIRMSLHCNYEQFMHHVWLSIVLRKQWKHVRETIRQQGFLAHDDLHLYLGPAIPFNDDDISILQLLCEYELPGEEDALGPEIPVMKYHAPFIKWSGSSSRVAFVNLLGDGIYPARGHLSIIVMPHPRFCQFWKTPQYHKQCIQKNYAQPPDVFDYWKFIHLMGVTWEIEHCDKMKRNAGGARLPVKGRVCRPLRNEYSRTRINEDAMPRFRMVTLKTIERRRQTP